MQAVWRKCRNLNLVRWFNSLEDSNAIKKIVEMALSIPLLPKNLMRSGMDVLREDPELGG